MNQVGRTTFDSRIAVASVSSYGSSENQPSEEISQALESIGQELHWSLQGHGPFGAAIPHGAKVLIKPNFVMHQNYGPWGMDPLVTHPSLIKATVEAVLRADPSEVLVGDAPLQGCDFDSLLRVTGLDKWSKALMERDSRFRGIRDFRRTTCTFVDGVRVAEEEKQSADRFVLFDLGNQSLLEPITDESASFRVTCYDPRLMAKTHSLGRHQYLVAREILEADLVIDLPKLKTHMKAGLTCALKNLIGINGNKEFLPHHRIGGLESGGDCYPGNSKLKRALEFVADQQNMTSSFTKGRLWRTAANQIYRVLHLKGDRLGIEGAWSGNDTIWRTCLDLNRILLYGRNDASMADAPQRRVIHIVDAIVAGQGNGPLAPQPLPLGLIFAGENAAAVDWIAAHLLGYVPERIPIAREAMKRFRWPLTSFSPSDIVLSGSLGSGPIDKVPGVKNVNSIDYPLGWRSAARHSENGDATGRPRLAELDG
jgi:uncharacterized protein (DUF362 family)